MQNLYKFKNIFLFSIFVLTSCNLFAKNKFNQANIIDVKMWNNKMPSIDFSGGKHKKKLAILTFEYRCDDDSPLKFRLAVSASIKEKFHSLQGSELFDCSGNKKLQGYYFSTENFFPSDTLIKFAFKQDAGAGDADSYDYVTEKKLKVFDTF